MKKRWIVVLALLAFLVTAVLHAPAPLLYAWIASPERPASIRLHGVHGTVASGGFAALTVNSRPALRDARWTLQPAWLALLRVAVDLEAGQDAVMRARISRAPFSALRLSQVSSAGSVKTLLQMLGQPALPIEGQARLDLPLIRIDDGVPIEAHGSVEIENLQWTLAREPLLLGSFNAALITEDTGILVKFGSGAGPLEVGGTAVLKPDRNYELDLQLRPRPGAPEQLLTLVRSLGPVDGQGWHHFRRQGPLP
jgi:general secretion pathway protein N